MNFVVWGNQSGRAQTETQRCTHRVGTGEPCLPMEKHRGCLDREDPSCLPWDSSRSQRTGTTGCQPLLVRGQRAVIWPRGPMKPPTRAQYSVVGRVGPVDLAGNNSLGRLTRRLLLHPTGAQYL